MSMITCNIVLNPYIIAFIGIFSFESNSMHVSGILKLKEVLTLKYGGLNMFYPSFIPQFYIGIWISERIYSWC